VKRGNHSDELIRFLRAKLVDLMPAASEGLVRLCPLCRNPTTTSVRRESLPVFQNVTYATREEAVAASFGSFLLATCGHCGFSHNCEFESDLVIYDDRYDNHVESGVFATYYKDLVDLMTASFDLGGGVVYDIGCGDGEFLKILCEMSPNILGIGIDPSCTPEVNDNYRLIQDTFEGYGIESGARLLLLRHVLEHLDNPIEFLKTLRHAISDTPLFVEVPDFEWILANGAFWDLSYEHCNYFTPQALRFALEMAGFEVIRQDRSFGNQYQWAICVPASSMSVPAGRGSMTTATVDSYARVEDERLTRVRDMAENANGLALWGMASKGVILAVLLPEGAAIGGIDMNRAKQGRFAATTGLQIHPPKWLLGQPGITVAILNPNYAEEIRILVQNLHADVKLTQL